MNPFLTKPQITYPKNIKQEVANLGIQHDDIRVFGSFIYRFQKYPGDVDVLENVTKRSETETVKYFVKRIKKIVQTIMDSNMHYFTDFKAGIDRNYEMSIGYLSNGIYYPNANFRHNIQILFDEGLLDEDDYMLMDKIVSSGTNLSANAFDTVMKIIRKYYILRWSPEEILKGSKKLRDGRKMTLEDAVRYKALVKIDEIVFLNDRFIEVTNIYGLHYETALGQSHDINMITKIGAITVEIEKLYYSDMYYSIFKAMKRIFAYCNHQYKSNNNEKYLGIAQKIVPILKNNVSLLYQLRSELESIILLYELYGNVSQESIARQLNNMKNRLATVTELDDADIIYFSNAIDDINDSHSLEIKLKALEGLSTYIKIYIDYFTVNYLNEVNFNPFPAAVLPDKSVLEIETPEDSLFERKIVNKYNHQIIREPLSMPFVDYEAWLAKIKLGSDIPINTDEIKEGYLENVNSL
jgi:hypothetical protein